jgi:predicted cupin superfamily sugar epimerase
MRRILALFLATVTTLSLSMAIPQSASALGGEWLGCRVAPGSEFNYYNTCHNTGGPDARGKYSVAFKVQAVSAPSTYSWVVPTGVQATVYSGCTTTSNSCTLLVPGYPGYDTQIEMVVFLTQGSSQVQLTSWANIYPWCQYC